jgi:hypothetical protein
VPDPIAYAVVPHLRGTLGEHGHTLGVTVFAGIGLAPVAKASFEAARARLGNGAKLVPEGEAAGILADWLDGVAAELRPHVEAVQADRQAAHRLLDDARALAAAPPDDEAPAAIEGYGRRVAEMAAAAEGRPAPRHLRHVESLRRLDPGAAPLVGHPTVRAALARLDAAVGALAGDLAALRQARDELASLAETATRKRGDRIAALEARLEKARRKPGLDRQRVADLAQRVEALARDLAALAAEAGPARQGEPT